jgi:uncharacterized membrane protein
MHYFPIPLFYLAVLSLLLILLLVLVEVGVLHYAYRRPGITREWVYSLLFVSLLGSYINIPVFQLPPEHAASGGQVTFSGVTYIIPVVENWPGAIIAVNLGGAVVPTLVSLYLMVKLKLLYQGIVAAAVITGLCPPDGLSGAGRRYRGAHLYPAAHRDGGGAPALQGIGARPCVHLGKLGDTDRR